MGGKPHPGMVGKPGDRKIGDIVRQGSVVERLFQGAAVDDGLAREVQQYGAAAERAEALPVDQPFRLGEQRNMQGYIVGLREEARQVFHALDLGRQTPRRLDGYGRVVAEHVHAQVQRRPGHQRADGAQAHHAQRLAEQFPALEAFLLRFHKLIEPGLVAHVLQRRDEGNPAHQVP